ncbi:hypothetical protein HDU81_003192 [Chytriomyces hyalinus]|nr:hypothetical protein HDU81_003192 [Chytriomyces hyalinus]
MSLVSKKTPLQAAAAPISANLPPLIKQQVPSKSRTPSVTNVSGIPGNAVKAAGRPSVVKLDPEVLQNEAEILGAVTRKLSSAGSAANVKGSAQTLTPKETLERTLLPKRATLKTPAPPAINLQADPIPKRPTTFQRNKLELPTNIKRPISAPHNNSDDVQEARIHANFMGNNLKSKKLMKEQAALGNLPSNGDENFSTE